MLVLRIVAAAAICLATYAVLPGIALELSPRPAADAGAPPLADFEISGVPHEPARDLSVWLLLALLCTALAAEAAIRGRSNIYLQVGIAACVCPLLAGGIGNQKRPRRRPWLLTSAFLLVASAAFWSRTRLAALADRWGWPASRRPTLTLRRDRRRLFRATPLAAMIVYVGGDARARHPPEDAAKAPALRLGLRIRRLGRGGRDDSLHGRRALQSKRSGRRRPAHLDRRPSCAPAGLSWRRRCWR